MKLENYHRNNNRARVKQLRPTNIPEQVKPSPEKPLLHAHK